MLMAFKHQTINCIEPTELLAVTFNHLDAMRDATSNNTEIIEKLDFLEKDLMKV